MRDYIQALVDADVGLDNADNALSDTDNALSDHTGDGIACSHPSARPGASLGDSPHAAPNPPSISVATSLGISASSPSQMPHANNSPLHVVKPHKSEKNYKSNLRQRARCAANHAAAQLQAETDLKAFILHCQHEACKKPLASTAAFGSRFDSVRTGPCWMAIHEARKAQDRTEYTLEEILAGGSIQAVDWDGRYELPQCPTNDTN